MIGGLQEGDSISADELDQIEAVINSLSWIVTFCQEHTEWFGTGTPDEGAEFEWLGNANKLLKEIS